jgi:hypothetical protein
MQLPQHVELIQAFGEIKITTEQYAELMETRFMSKSTVARAYYDNWLINVPEDMELLHTHVEAYVVYASIIRADRIALTTNLHDKDVHVLLQILDSSATPRTDGLETRLADFYKERARIHTVHFEELYRSNLPSLPDVYRDMAFQDWGSDLTSGICRLGGLMLKVDANTDLSAPQEPSASTISQDVFHQRPSGRSKTKTRRNAL